MEIKNFLELKDAFELEKYVRNMDFDKKNCCSFYGSPKKHPYEKERVILVADPFGEQTFYYDFKLKDILSIEEQPRFRIKDYVDSAVRLWVKNGSVGLQCTPFAVGRTIEMIKGL